MELEDVDEGAIVGYEDLYSEQALEDFLQPYTVIFTDAITLAQTKIEELWRPEELEDEDNIFDGNDSSRVEDWQNTSRIRDT